MPAVSEAVAATDHSANQSAQLLAHDAASGKALCTTIKTTKQSALCGAIVLPVGAAL
jgi:hypothetical protein